MATTDVPRIGHHDQEENALDVLGRKREQDPERAAPANAIWVLPHPR